MTRNTFTSTAMMRALAAGIRGNIPTLLWGDPGQGKTARIEAHAKAWGRHCETVVGSVRESSDYLGLPVEVDGAVVYSPPSWARRLSEAAVSLLFLDELTTAAPSVQKAMLRVLQEREVGEHSLPDTVAIVAAANPPETAADGWDLPAPIANRVMHLDWHFDADEWLNGVGTGFAHQIVPTLDQMLGDATTEDRARVSGAITAFLRARPELLAPPVPTDPVAAGRAWPSPRSWTNAITALTQLHPGDEDAAFLVLKGCVGEGATTEFLAWISLADLHNPADVLADPAIVDWSGERPDRLFALTSALASLALSRGDKRSWEKAVAALTMCAQEGKPDVALPPMRTLLNHLPEDATIAAATRTAFADLFTRTGRWAA